MSHLALLTTKRITKASSINNTRNQSYIRNGSPYLSEEERRRINERQNKKKWITKKGFVCSLGNYSADREIKNYVNETPSENPFKYKFRDKNKRKWINYKGFMF